jgi:hypothetical protein
VPGVLHAADVLANRSAAFLCEVRKRRLAVLTLAEAVLDAAHVALFVGVDRAHPAPALDGVALIVGDPSGERWGLLNDGLWLFDLAAFAHGSLRPHFEVGRSLPVVIARSVQKVAVLRV